VTRLATSALPGLETIATDLLLTMKVELYRNQEKRFTAEDAESAEAIFQESAGPSTVQSDSRENRSGDNSLSCCARDHKIKS